METTIIGTFGTIVKRTFEIVRTMRNIRMICTIAEMGTIENLGLKMIRTVALDIPPTPSTFRTQEKHGVRPRILT